MQIYFQTTFNIELLTKKGHNSYELGILQTIEILTQRGT